MIEPKPKYQIGDQPENIRIRESGHRVFSNGMHDTGQPCPKCGSNNYFLEMDFDCCMICDDCGHLEEQGYISTS